ncbi:MAG: guanylate kinase [Pseudohongiellaceae bacterium]|jgi:guanylate kinase
MSDSAGRLVVISGSSGSGKSSIIARLKAHPRVRVSVSATTRARREGEVDGEHYHFLDLATFQERHEKGDFVETNDVFSAGNLYGSLRADLDAALEHSGEVYIMEVDVVGAQNITAAGYEGAHFFIMAPSRQVLEERLRDRGTDSEGAIERRLATADAEERMARESDATLITNENINEAVKAILAQLHLDPLAT